MTATSAEQPPRSREEAQARLCVVLACHNMVCALPIDNIDRLVLPEAVEPVEAPRAAAGRGRDAGAGGAVPDVVRVAGKFFAAWDLGTMLGQPPVSGAWVLLALMHEGAEVALALRTGPCYAVQTLRNLMKLPNEVFDERRGAMTDAFGTSAVKQGRIEGDVGVLIDPKGLWTKQELHVSAAVLDAIEGRGNKR